MCAAQFTPSSWCSRKVRKNRYISFVSLGGVPIQLMQKQEQFRVCCAIQSKQPVLEKGSKELKYFFPFLLSVPIQLGCIKEQFPLCCAIQFEGVRKKRRESGISFFFYSPRTYSTQVQRATVLCVLRN